MEDGVSATSEAGNPRVVIGADFILIVSELASRQDVFLEHGTQQSGRLLTFSCFLRSHKFDRTTSLLRLLGRLVDHVNLESLRCALAYALTS